MSTQTRKQREILVREDLILKVAREMLVDHGYHGITMDRIAKAVEYSKGTIYLHFSCKEEVLIEIATRILDRRLAMVERALTFKGRPRERMVATGEAVEIFARLYPDDLRILNIIETEVITQKVSEERIEARKNAEYRVLSLMTGVVREGIAQGDLELSADTSPEELPFALWSVTDGGYAIILRDLPLSEIGVQDPFRTIMKICDTLGDGYGWRPLSTEADYVAVRARIRQTVFADEVRRLRDRSE